MSKFIQDLNIGKNIQKLRKMKGFTQENICAKLDLAGRPMIRSTYAQIETGKRNIFVSDLIAIKNILNVEYEDIFNDLQPINKYESNSFFNDKT